MEQFDNVKEVQEPMVDRAVATRAIMTGSIIRAASVAAGVGIGAMALKVKPKTAIQAALVPAVIELGTTYLSVRASDDEQLEEAALERDKKRNINDAAMNFIFGSVALMVGVLIARQIKVPEETATE